MQSKRQTKYIYTLEKKQLSPSFLESAWKCNPEIKDLKVWELYGNECLDFFISIEIRSSDSNNISTQQRNKETMQKLQSYSELVELVITLKNDYKFCDFYESTDGWLIDQENKEYCDMPPIE